MECNQLSRAESVLATLDKLMDRLTGSSPPPKHEPIRLPSRLIDEDDEAAYHAVMKRVLLTGMSGTGKSTLICELAARGYRAIDMDDDEWSEWVNVSGDGPEGPDAGRDWVWREDRIQRLLATEDADVLFVSGCASNQGKFHAQFDHIVLLSAPTPLIVERLATRTNNPYGKHPDELAQILRYVQTVEPLLKRSASLEVDTSVPIDQVVETVLSLVRT